MLDQRPEADSLHDVLRAADVEEFLAWRVWRLTELHRHRRAQLSRVNHDSLTGLLRRSTWQERAEKLVKTCVGSTTTVGLLYLDLDHFKAINDRYGHAIGDEILLFVADCLRDWFAPDDLIARLGGDEFVVMLRRDDELAVANDARRFVAHFCTIRYPISPGAGEGGERARARNRGYWRGTQAGGAAQRAPLSVSGGLTFVRGQLALDELVEAADLALYRAKSEGRGRLIVVDELAEVLASEGKDLRVDHFENVTRVVTERVTSLITLMGRRLMNEATRDAYRDALTGLHNRRYLDEHVERELEAAQRNHRALSLVFLDLDHFHDINMTYGWPTGDSVLRAFAGVLERSVRMIDWSARYGGEEFCLVLPDTLLAEAVEVAERIREHTEALTIVSSDGRPVKVTTSIGVVQRGAEMRAVELFDRVGELALAAKQRGRNCVVSPLNLALAG
nr:GGDEF domain-containing protein [Niveibacterium umoris]